MRCKHRPDLFSRQPALTELIRSIIGRSNAMLLLLLGLAGCTLTPVNALLKRPHDNTISAARERAKPVSGPKSPSEAPVLEDNQPTLDECIRAALQQNPRLAAARWDRQSSRHELQLARSMAMPDLRATAD